MKRPPTAIELQEQYCDLGEIDKQNIREAALSAALSIMTHAKKTDGFLSGETITQIIMDRFSGFTKR